jgi:hypothetical protein
VLESKDYEQIWKAQKTAEDNIKKEKTKTSAADNTTETPLTTAI